MSNVKIHMRHQFVFFHVNISIRHYLEISSMSNPRVQISSGLLLYRISYRMTVRNGTVESDFGNTRFESLPYRGLIVTEEEPFLFLSHINSHSRPQVIKYSKFCETDLK